MAVNLWALHTNFEQVCVRVAISSPFHHGHCVSAGAALVFEFYVYSFMQRMGNAELFSVACQIIDDPIISSDLMLYAE